MWVTDVNGEGLKLDTALLGVLKLAIGIEF